MDFSNQNEAHCEYVASQYQPGVATFVKEKAFNAMNELDGWCSQHRASVLIDLILAIQPQTVVEIGVYAGRSLIPMAFALQANRKGIIYGIDSWDMVDSIEGTEGKLRSWLSTLNYRQAMNNLFNKIEQFGLQNQISIIRSPSKKAAPIYDIDILQIDGNQSEEGIYRDVIKWVPFVKNGGIVVLNNVSWAANGKVNPVKATEWLNQYCAKQAHFGDGNEWAIWLKL